MNQSKDVIIVIENYNFYRFQSEILKYQNFLGLNQSKWGGGIGCQYRGRKIDFSPFSTKNLNFTILREIEKGAIGRNYRGKKPNFCNFQRKKIKFDVFWGLNHSKRRIICQNNLDRKLNFSSFSSKKSEKFTIFW